MNTVLIMLLVPAISILATLNLSMRQFGDFRPLLTGVVMAVIVGLALLFIGLPFRRWCRRNGKNHLGYWLLQWLLVFLSAAPVVGIGSGWYDFLVSAQLMAFGMGTALAAWFLADCRPFKPRT